MNLPQFLSNIIDPFVEAHPFVSVSHHQHNKTVSHRFYIMPKDGRMYITDHRLSLITSHLFVSSHFVFLHSFKQIIQVRMRPNLISVSYFCIILFFISIIYYYIIVLEGILELDLSSSPTFYNVMANTRLVV